MTFKPRSAGEALVERELRVEKRAGVDHYVTGQHHFEPAVEPDLADQAGVLSFVNVGGHAVAIVVYRHTETRVWCAAFSREVGYAGAYDTGARNVPEDFEFTDKMRAVLPD